MSFILRVRVEASLGKLECCEGRRNFAARDPTKAYINQKSTAPQEEIHSHPRITS